MKFVESETVELKEMVVNDIRKEIIAFANCDGGKLYIGVPATDTAIRAMIRETDGEHFEEIRSLYQELSFDATENEFQKRKVAFGSPQMKTLGLVNADGIYTNLAFLLSDQCSYTTKVAVFEGTGQSVFKDRKEFSGSLLQQMEEVYDFIDFHNQTYATFDKLYRIDTRDYPEMAVREALLNSIVHREYAMSASTLISIFADRIEFTSIGGLVTGVTLDDILMGISICRNERLANVFYRLELIEAYGTGMKKIMEAYENVSMKPKIEISNNVFKVILPNINFEGNKIEVEEISRAIDKKTVVLSFIKEQGQVKRKEIQELLQVSQATCSRILKQMIETGVIVQTGSGKNIYYRVA